MENLEDLPVQVSRIIGESIMEEGAEQVLPELQTLPVETLLQFHLVWLTGIAMHAGTHMAELIAQFSEGTDVIELECEDAAVVAFMSGTLAWSANLAVREDVTEALREMIDTLSGLADQLIKEAAESTDTHD